MFISNVNFYTFEVDFIPEGSANRLLIKYLL